MNRRLLEEQVPMGTESRSMELKVMSCKDMKCFNFFQKISTYAVVSIVSDDSKKKQRLCQHKTPIDREGDGNPEWNHEMQIDLKDISFTDCDNIFIEFDLRCEAIVFGDKPLGQVRVPLKDLIEEFNGGVRYVSYQIRTTDGKPNGILNFSYKVSDKEEKTGSRLQANNQIGMGGYPIVQYPPPEVHCGSPEIHYPTLDIEDIIYPPQEPSYSVPPPPPPPLPHMVPLDIEDIAYPPQEPTYSVPPPRPPPLPHMVPLDIEDIAYPPQEPTYSVPPPPPPPLPHMVYTSPAPAFMYYPPPAPYGFQSGSYGYYGYPPPSVGRVDGFDGNAWRDGRKCFEGTWNGS